MSRGEHRLLHSSKPWSEKGDYGHKMGDYTECHGTLKLHGLLIQIHGHINMDNWISANLTLHFPPVKEKGASTEVDAHFEDRSLRFYNGLFASKMPALWLG